MKIKIYAVLVMMINRFTAGEALKLKTFLSFLIKYKKLQSVSNWSKTIDQQKTS